jgi:hypothetical protein
MQQTTGVAVIATQLHHTDRRALSQAWYNALHLAGRAPRPQRGPCRATPSATPASAPRSAHEVKGTSPRRDDVPVVRACRSGGTASREAVVTERRAPKPELAGRIERALTRGLPGAAASFTVRASAGRVHLLVRSEGARTRVVAVCAATLRERVERALAHVRFACAGRVHAEVA